jgi:short-subunit dehydrogenase involved in D-alanine esterification of teichoic acids
MDRKLENKAAVVTGGCAGIGSGGAKRFEEGARVFITGRRQSELDREVHANSMNTFLRPSLCSKPESNTIEL